MAEHPIQGLMNVTMEKIHQMVDSNTIIGKPIITEDGTTILPDFGSGQPTVEDRVSCRVSAQALFIVLAAVRVLYEFWRKKVLDIFL